MNSGLTKHSFFSYKSLTKSSLFRVLLVSSALAGLLGCAQKNESQEDENEEGHALLGLVQAVDVEGLSMTVAHEEIPDFMPPMTMVFRVSAGDVKTFKKDDQIKARMIRDEDGGFRLIKIWKIDDESAATMRRVNKRLAKKVDEMGSGYYLAEGDAFPEFALVDQFGETVTPTHYKGKPFMLNFIFTRCTDAEMCPLSTSKMATLQRLSKEAGLEDLEFVSVTLDPKYDTPGVLRTYADAYGIDGENFRFVTGEKVAVRQLIKSMALTHIEAEDDIIHSLATVLVDRERNIVMRSVKKAWDPMAFLEAAKGL